MDDFLFGLHFDYFQGIPGIYVTDHHIKAWRYFSTYNNGRSKKK